MTERTHDANGHLLDGPRLKQPSLWRLCPRSPDWDAPSPDVARAQMQIKRRAARRTIAMHERMKRLVRAIKNDA